MSARPVSFATLKTYTTRRDTTPAFAGMTRVVVFSHPPLEGEVSRAERGMEGCHPHDGGTPLRLALASHLPCRGG